MVVAGPSAVLQFAEKIIITLDPEGNIILKKKYSSAGVARDRCVSWTDYREIVRVWFSNTCFRGFFRRNNHYIILLYVCIRPPEVCQRIKYNIYLCPARAARILNSCTFFNGIGTYWFSVATTNRKLQIAVLVFYRHLLVENLNVRVKNWVTYILFTHICINCIFYI